MSDFTVISGGLRMPDPLAMPKKPRTRKGNRNAGVLRDGVVLKDCPACGAPGHGPIEYQARRIGVGHFLNSHPRLIKVPLAFSVSTRNTTPIARLGWVLADRDNLPFLDSKHMEIVGLKGDSV